VRISSSSDVSSEAFDGKDINLGEVMMRERVRRFEAQAAHTFTRSGLAWD